MVRNKSDVPVKVIRISENKPDFIKLELPDLGTGAILAPQESQIAPPRQNKGPDRAAQSFSGPLPGRFQSGHHPGDAIAKHTLTRLKGANNGAARQDAVNSK